MGSAASVPEREFSRDEIDAVVTKAFESASPDSVEALEKLGWTKLSQLLEEAGQPSRGPTAELAARLYAHRATSLKVSGGALVAAFAAREAAMASPRVAPAPVEYSLETDKAALIALYHSTNGPQWTKNKGWLTDAPVSEWFGVTVEDGRVTKLELIENNLQGKGGPV